MDLDEILAAIRETDWDAIESARDYDDDVLDELLPVYSTLETWLQKVAFANVVQDSKDPRVRPIMLDILRAPLDQQRDVVECTKAAALGFVDEAHDRFQHYYNDRDALHAAVAEVLGAIAPPPPPAHSSVTKMSNEEPPLLAASVAGRRDVVLAQIAAGADVTMTRVGGQTALWWAANHGWLDVVRALLARGAPVDQADRYGGTPLYQAVQSSAAVTRELLAAGANPRTTYQDGRTPVWFAAHTGHVDVVRELLAAGVGIDEQHSDATMLGIACGENHAALVDDLLARGANPDLPSTRFGERQTPLMIAASCGYPGLVRKLLAAGADRTIAIDGKRAIDVATGRRADEVQALLR